MGADRRGWSRSQPLQHSRLHAKEGKRKAGMEEILADRSQNAGEGL